MGAEALQLENCLDWSTAREVQQRFMKDLAPPIDSLDYSALCRQMRQLGGDCYGFVPLPDKRLGFAVGDASGKGVAAALMISNVQSSIRTAAMFAWNDVAAVLSAVNRQVDAASSADRYATLFYGAFDPASRTLRYVNAGHNPTMIIRRGGSIDWLESGGAPVGMFPAWPYEQGNVELNPGDLVLAYTDGVIEAGNAFGDEWGMEGLRNAAARVRGRSAADIVNAIFTAMDEFSCGRQIDDATVAILRVR